MPRLHPGWDPPHPVHVLSQLSPAPWRRKFQSISILYLLKHKSSWAADKAHPARAFLLPSALCSSGLLRFSLFSYLGTTPILPAVPTSASLIRSSWPHAVSGSSHYRHLCINSFSGSMPPSMPPARDDNSETKPREGLHRTRKLALTGKMRGAALGLFRRHTQVHSHVVCVIKGGGDPGVNHG